MKRKPQLLSLVLSCAMLFMCTVPSIAAVDSLLSENQVDATLASRGFPESIIASISYPQKLEIYEDDNLQFSSAKVLSFSEDGTLENEVLITPHSPDPLSGTIPKSDLKLIILTSNTYVGGKLDNSLVHLSYEWLSLPFNRYRDPMCLVWDSNLFEYQSGSFQKTDYFDAIAGSVSYTYRVKETSTQLENLTFGAASWSADLKAYDPYDSWSAITKLHGYGSIRLKAKSAVSSQSQKYSPIYAQYIHVQTGLSVGLSFGAFGISASSNLAPSMVGEGEIRWP